ncbi:hypothetical protein [Pseudobdellovibrio exovorus]|uniref:Uncharacterized protein n=1 Tax=Pseudobdellovibrio exovorus JSS TaxID=1184267 RepID=M4VQ01_9BACT|nr:hypothetical protein [Pseudobdellovibrio exovorus]AGH95224.1 hypothetical protein A11Q_1008 [Pseudobdellovibrio exovorus JSS]
MSKFSSAYKGLKGFFFIILIAVVMAAPAAYADIESQAVIEKVTDSDRLLATSQSEEWHVGETLVIVSQDLRRGVIGFVEVIGTRKIIDGLYEVRLGLLRQSRKVLIQPGDFARRLDLSSTNPDYIGTTDLLLRDKQMQVSAQYRPLVYQGLAIGDTAQTLFEDEFLINYLGDTYYGFKDWLTVGSFIPANFFGRPNANFRAKFYDSEATTLAAGVSFARLVKEDQGSVNLNFFWDSISSDALISHTFVGIGIVEWDGAEDAAALKYVTSSSFQTGYEVILNNWDRFLIGPNYNFAKKALGGYLSYVWTMEHFHFQLSVNSTDITSLRLDPSDGYYGFFDLYWRF